MVRSAKMMRYKAWADDLLFDVLTGLSSEQLVAPQEIVFGSLLATANHSFSMDMVWQSNLLGKPHGITSRKPEQCMAIDELARAQREIDSWYVGYAESLEEHQLNESVDFDFIDGGSGRMSREEVLLHVMNHATYHRGQITSMLYQFKVAPPTTDLPVYLRELGG